MSFEDDLQGDTPEDITIGGGSAWVITKAGNLIRYDLASPKRVLSVPVGKSLSHVVFASGAAWVTEDDDGTGCDMGNSSAHLLRIDAATNTVTTKIVVVADPRNSLTQSCERFDGLVTDGTSVFALINNAFGVAKIDPTTNTVTKRIALGELEGEGSGYLAINDSTIWVDNVVDHFIIALDIATVAVRKKSAIPTKYLGQEMVATKDAAFLEGTNGSTTTDVLRVDNANTDTQVEKTFPEPPDTMTVMGTTLYIAAAPGYSVSSDLLSFDDTNVTQQSKTTIPYLYSVDKFVFVP